MVVLSYTYMKEATHGKVSGMGRAPEEKRDCHQGRREGQLLTVQEFLEAGPGEETPAARPNLHRGHHAARGDGEIRHRQEVQRHQDMGVRFLLCPAGACPALVHEGPRVGGTGGRRPRMPHRQRIG
ncbi:hypothetical protein SDC9_209229 [bioreactor metagenome]|uniref:Uncharacterized protein n=1 Tax=bioreactor metagenome TaxID=1076179 RepID=A0A645JE82_9ZZZZ